ncbi:MAG: HEAT repeat domain-containing protein [Planctomycetales bacterium]|nr:HEAT repeat domain-containing protein [Planctomycetales bacterium]
MSLRKLLCLLIAIESLALATTNLPLVQVGLAQEPAAEADPKSSEDSKPPEEPVLFKEPRTPVELFEATLLMVEISRPNLARYYLRKLMNPPPEAATLLALRDRFGVADFLRLADQKELRPTSIELLDLSNDAATARLQDPQHLEQLAGRLVAGGEEQAQAIEELRAFGSAAVSPLMSLWRKSPDPATRRSVRTALRSLGQPALPALTAALDVSDPDWQIELLGVLAEIGSRDAVPYVWFSAVDPSATADVREAASRMITELLTRTNVATKLSVESVSRELRQQATEHFRSRLPWEPDLFTGQVVMWHWDAKDELLLARSVAPREAARRAGLHFARQTITLTPDDRESQVLFLALALSNEGRTGDAGTTDAKPLPAGVASLPDYAKHVGVDVLQDVLRLSQQQGRSRAAVRTLRLLGDLATWEQIRPHGEASSPVYDAIGARDPRVQFEAVDTVLRLDPPATTSFPGSTRIVSILSRALTASGTPRVIVADSSTAHANFVGGLFAELGYEPILITSGRDVFRVAAERGDIDFVVLNPNLTRWPLSETLANLRADSRTSSVPVLVSVSQLASADLDVSKQRLLLKSRVEPLLKDEKYRSVAFFPESKSSPVLERVLEDFLARLPPKTLSPRERQARVVVADPSFEHGTFVGRMFGSLGYTPIVVTTGNEVRAASDQSRVELVVLHAGITSGTASETFARLRAEGQASKLPIIVMFRDVVPGDPNTMQQRIAELIGKEGDGTLLAEHAVVKLAASLRNVGVKLTPSQLTRLRELARLPNSSDFHVGLLAAIESFEHIATRVEELTPKFDSPALAVALPKQIQGFLREPSGNVKLIFESQTSTAIDRQIRPILDSLPVRPLTQAERADHAQRAARWLAHLATNPTTRTFDITPAESALVTALDGNPELANSAITALAEISTKSSQQRIAAVVLATHRPPKLRRQAASLLDRHAEKHGNLLSKATIEKLRQVWDELGPTAPTME